MTPVHPKAPATLLVACFISGLLGCDSSVNTYAPPPPPEVTVANPAAKSIRRFFDQNGETEVAEEVEVRSRVKGFIEAIKFEPGQRVEVGEILYLIERNTYEADMQSANAAVDAAAAAVAVAVALVKNMEADLAKADADLGREKRLLENNAGSQADYDRALAASDSAKAAIESAKASVEAARADKGRAEADVAQAKLNLDYTKVTAPIAGRISKTIVKKGNLVDNGTHLATIVNRDRIFANFNISDRQMLEFQEEKRAKLQIGEQLEEPDWSEITVLLRRETDRGFPFTGVLDYIDQAGIDPDTGTLGLRAVFDNSNDELIGGMFVTVRIPAEDKINTLLIPEMALARDQQGTFVLTVNDQNKVEQTRVSVTERVSGWAMISSGIDESTRVIIDGLQRALPGGEVAVSQTRLEVDEASLIRGMDPVSGNSAAKAEPSDGDSNTNDDSAVN